MHFFPLCFDWEVLYSFRSCRSSQLLFWSLFSFRSSMFNQYRIGSELAKRTYLHACVKHISGIVICSCPFCWTNEMQLVFLWIAIENISILRGCSIQLPQQLNLETMSNPPLLLDPFTPLFLLLINFPRQLRWLMIVNRIESRLRKTGTGRRATGKRARLVLEKAR